MWWNLHEILVFLIVKIVSKTFNDNVIKQGYLPFLEALCCSSLMEFCTVMVLHDFCKTKVLVSIERLHFLASVCSYLYSVKHEEFFDKPFGYTIPLNNPLSWLGGGSFIVMSIDPDRHCIRTVGSIIDDCDVAANSIKNRKKWNQKNDVHDRERWWGFNLWLLHAINLNNFRITVHWPFLRKT